MSIPINKHTSAQKTAHQPAGEFNVWVCAAGVTAALLMVGSLLLVIGMNGLGFFWPKPLVEFQLANGSQILGQVIDKEIDQFNPEKPLGLKLKVGNRDLYGQDFRWIDSASVKIQHIALHAVVLERKEYGDFYGFLHGLSQHEEGGQNHNSQPARDNRSPDERWQQFKVAFAAAKAAQAKIKLAQQQLTNLNHRTERLKNKLQAIKYQQPNETLINESLAIEEKLQRLAQTFQINNNQIQAQVNQLRKKVALFKDVSGQAKTMPLMDIIRATQPNQMSVFAKAQYYGVRLWELLSADPRESNTEGGVFPAIFGTVMMVFLMSMFSVPLGVITAIYLKEYAHDGWLVKLVRIAVYNLAGVPSIVFGVFGLGFFIYGVGGSIDSWFFAERLPTPTFGTGGILWASLTLALLTVPVVVVATEEGLSAIPQRVREASLALGATRLQTLMRVILPMSLPGIMTGFVLAVARAAGETAPLMITGAVKLAPNLPFDSYAPYLHLDRKFMHLGFHIFDVGFQSPNAEAAQPMVYLSTILLLSIVVLLSLIAILMRNMVRKRIAGAVF